MPVKSISPVGFRFNEARATEIAAHLIERVGEGGVLNYTKLLKLMYLIDRRMLLEWKEPAVGGRYVSMNNGPLQSRTYDLIRNPALGTGIWGGHIERAGRFNVRLKSAPGTGHFNKALRRVIDEVLAEHGGKSFGDLIEYCHDHCPEWQDPAGSSSEIAYEEIFTREDRAAEIPALKRHAREVERLAEAFGDR